MAQPLSRNPPNGGQQRSCAHVIAELLAMEDLKRRDRDDMASAIRTLCRGWGVEPEALPANVQAFRERLKGATAAAMNLDARRFSNVKSLALKSFRLTDVATMPTRHRDPMTAPYAELFASLKSTKGRRALSRFFRWLSIRGTPPEAVKDEILAAFLDAMVTGSIMTRPRDVQRDAAKEWNAAAANHPEWPQQRLTVPCHKDSYFLPWEVFPASLKTEFLEKYLHRVQGTSLFSEYRGKPLRPATIKNQTYQLQQVLSAFVHAGGDPTTLKSLADVVALRTLEPAIEWLAARNNGKASWQTNLIAGLMLNIARHWVKADSAHLAVLKNLCMNTKQERRGMAASSRAMLRPFDDDENVLKILRLPQYIEKLVRHKKVTVATSLLMQTATAVEIMVMNPLRIKSLSAMRQDEHVIHSRNGKMHLVVEGSETKTGKPNTGMLPDVSAALISIYEKRYRPLLAGPTSTALFPGPGDATKYCKTLSAQISRHILEVTGLKLTPHKFRHFFAKHYLRDNPGGIGTVQRVLGHGKIGETCTYVDFQNDDALRHLDEHVLRKREEGAPALKTRRRPPPVVKNHPVDKPATGEFETENET